MQHRQIEKGKSTNRNGIQKIVDQSTRTNSGSYIDALHARQPLANGERLVRAKSDKRTAKKKQKKHQNGTHEPKIRPQEGRKWHQGCPKMVLRGAEDDPKTDPKPQVERRRAPRRSHDRLGPAKGRRHRLFPHF